jgi:hypothetical protein
MTTQKQLSFADYEGLCAEACQGFAPSGSRDADEETLMLRVLRKVYSFLEEDVDSFPIQDVSNLHSYKWKVQQLVSQGQSEWFDTLETPGKYINQELDKFYN